MTWGFGVPRAECPLTGWLPSSAWKKLTWRPWTQVPPDAVSAEFSRRGVGGRRGRAGLPQTAAHWQDARVPARGLPAAGWHLQTTPSDMQLGNRHHAAASCQSSGGCSRAPTACRWSLCTAATALTDQVLALGPKVQADGHGHVFPG